MPKPKETIITDHIILPQEMMPRIVHPHFDNTANIVGNLSVYLWVSKSDPLPFFLGIGTELEAHSTLHKNALNKQLLQQIYRNIVGTKFQCLIIQRRISYCYALCYFDYLYDLFKNRQHESNRPGLLCNKHYQRPAVHQLAFPPNPPTTLPFFEAAGIPDDPIKLEEAAFLFTTILNQYTTNKDMNPLPPGSPEHLAMRQSYKTELASKLEIQRKNEENYQRQKALREQARKKLSGE
jgi:hypothetical protein